MVRGIRWAAALACAHALLGAAPARGQYDAVSGLWRDPYSGSQVVSVNVTSGPNGESPSGTITFFALAGPAMTGTPQLVCVSGNTAMVALQVPMSPEQGLWTLFTLFEDRTLSGLPDRATFVLFQARWGTEYVMPLPATCAGPWPGLYQTFISGQGHDIAGDIIVGDDLEASQLVDVQVPCTGPAGTDAAWQNHGEYVQSVARWVNTMIEAGIISAEEADAIVSARGRSGCGGR